MDKRELIARRLYSQHITNAAEPETVCRDLNGLQAQFISNVFAALSLRCPQDPTEALPPSLIKSWTVRGTMHVFSEKDLPLFLYEGRTHFLRPVDRLDVDDPFCSARRKFHFVSAILERLSQGPASREELKALCLESGMTDTEAQGIFDPWGGLIRALSETGKIAGLVSQNKIYRLCPEFQPMGKEEAELALLARYFQNFGPASLVDAAYYTGFPRTRLKALMDQLPLIPETVGGRTLFTLGPAPASLPEIPKCLFLPGFDQMLLGYEKKENPILPPEHLRSIFNLAGIVFPSILLDGTIIGRWKRDGKRINLTLFALCDENMILQEAKARFPGAIPQITH